MSMPLSHFVPASPSPSPHVKEVAWVTGSLCKVLGESGHVTLGDLHTLSRLSFHTRSSVTSSELIRCRGDGRCRRGLQIHWCRMERWWKVMESAGWKGDEKWWKVQERSANSLVPSFTNCDLEWDPSLPTFSRRGSCSPLSGKSWRPYDNLYVSTLNEKALRKCQGENSVLNPRQPLLHSH